MDRELQEARDALDAAQVTVKQCMDRVLAAEERVRQEKAIGPFLAEKVLGWMRNDIGTWYDSFYTLRCLGESWRPQEREEQALMVMEEMMKKQYCYNLTFIDHSNYSVIIQGNHPQVRERGASLAEAICRATKKMLEKD